MLRDSRALTFLYLSQPVANVTNVRVTNPQPRAIHIQSTVCSALSARLRKEKAQPKILTDVRIQASQVLSLARWAFILSNFTTAARILFVFPVDEDMLASAVFREEGDEKDMGGGDIEV
jgi:hypothetical protein